MANTNNKSPLDQAIQAAVIDELAWDSRIDASAISVHVADGFVYLTGTVPSYSALNAAESDALGVNGVVGVDNELRVQLPTSLPVPSDTTIKEHIALKLEINPDLDASNIHVAVTAGVVMLTGTVPNHWEKQAAAVLAAGVTGVIAVENDLAVVPTAMVADETIAEAVVAALTRSNVVAAERVDVTVSRGEVRLQGKVPTAAARQAAERAASHTEGVIRVVNQVEVEHSSTRARLG